MNIAVNGSVISGKYESAVGGAAGQVFPLSGMVDQTAGSTSQSVGFTVIWNNGQNDYQSATGWCGQLQSIGGQDTITAMWLLNSETEPSSNWASTLIGQDVFTRTPPIEAQAAELRKKHPYRHW
ncbi:MAG: hypothetical protein RL141_986 [Candidatus Parcubacteria bacterium]